MLGTWNPLAAIALETAAIVFALGLADQPGRRRPYTAVLGVYAVLSVLMLSNAVYALAFGRPLDPRMLNFAGEGAEVTDSILDLIGPIHLLYLIDLPVLAAWAVALSRGEKRGQVAPRNRRRVVAATAAAGAVLLVQVALVLRLPADASAVATIGRRGFGPTEVAGVVRTALPWGRDDAAVVTAGGRSTQHRIESIRRARSGERIAPFAPGAFAGKNLIVIQVETLQSLAIGAEIDGHQVTPNLNRLAREGWYFPNAISQAGTGVTSDAEFIANSGLLPPAGGPAALAYADREIPALPRLLRARGYDAFTLHTNRVTFWNRDQLYPALGFERYYDRELFRDRDRMWHSSDEVLFEDGLGVLTGAKATGRPFYAQFVTMTSHSPFTYPKDMSRRPLKVPERWRDCRVGRYASAISYADGAIGGFVEGLKRAGLYDDSVIVIYGDHTGLRAAALSGPDDEVMREMIGRGYGDPDRVRIPLIIHLPAEEPRVFTDVVGQIDIMPTIADLLGVDLDAVPHVGRSAFVRSGALAPTRSFVPGGSFANDRVLFMPGLGFDDGRAVSVEDGSPAEATETERRDLERTRKLSALSDAWVRGLPRRAGAERGADKGF